MIRLATIADGPRVFQLQCCARGEQGSYPVFEHAYDELVGSGDDVCLVAEGSEGDIWGFISLRASDPADADDPMAVSHLAVSARMRGMQALFVARAYRLAGALRRCGRLSARREAQRIA